MTDSLKVKKDLYEKCKDFINQRVANIKEAMISLKESAEEETKSTAGDKYETGRAMIQIELENCSRQLSDARQLLQALDQISPRAVHQKCVPGSLVSTNNGDFYIAISIGKLTLDNKDYFVVSPTSPIGEKLMHSQAGDTVEVNGRTYKVNNVE